MLRLARIIGPSYPHHLVQRGNNRRDVFLDHADRQSYLALLARYAQKQSVSVLAYCLMSNHTHLLVRPGQSSNLPKMMQGIALCYTQAFNRKYGQTGRLWESRYHSSVVEEERYLWAVSCYIEQNPIRARLATRAEEYPYSSAAAHLLGAADPVLGEALFDQGEIKAYRALMQELPPAKIDAIRKQTRSGRPLGTGEFAEKLGGILGRNIAHRPRGRPRLSKAQDHRSTV